MNHNVETVTSKTDTLLVSLGVILAVAGVLGFSLLTDLAIGLRLAVLAGGIGLGALVAWFSPSGKRLIAYAGQSWDELRRVVWPTRKETLNTTGIVMVFVFIMALFLFLIDRIIEWGLYDFLLRLTF